MSDPSLGAAPRCLVAIQLLDSQGYAVQTWKFSGQSVITIGRAEDQDVSIGDPRVSRSHAELRREDDQWVLVSLGRSGVMLDGKPVTQTRLEPKRVFFLGAGGASLRFDEVPEFGESNRGTIDFDSAPGLLLFVDEERKQREVEEIADSDYFQKLQRAARDLKRQRMETD